MPGWSSADVLWFFAVRGECSCQLCLFVLRASATALREVRGMLFSDLHFEQVFATIPCMNSQLPTARDAATLELAREMCELAAHLHAGTARLARLAAEFDRAEGWAGDGMRSCAQWLSINTGHGLAAAGDLVRVGHALETLPLISEAFASGELSLDKVR